MSRVSWIIPKKVSGIGSLKMGNINPLNFLSASKPISYPDVENYKLIYRYRI